MARLLVLYASETGQTQKIAERISQQMRDNGHTVDCLDIGELPGDFDIDVYAGVLVGAPIRIMQFPKAVVKFAKRFREQLTARKAGFFTVCMAVANKGSESTQELDKWRRTFEKETGWAPAFHAEIAGALMYTKYDFVTRMVMKKISAKEGHSTDTSCDHEYTDWDQVEKFTDDYLKTLT